MPLVFPAGILSMALLNSPHIKEEERPLLAECESASSHIELAAEPTGRAPVVCVSPGLATTLLFDSPIVADSVDLQGRERFADVSVGRSSLTVVPPEALAPGERFTVGVRFVDGAAPKSAAFVLMGHPGLSPRQVEVLRQPRTVAYYQQVVKELEAEAQQLRAMVEQLRAEHGGQDGLRGALASELMGRGWGVAVRDLSRSAKKRMENALLLKEVYSYRASGRVAVEVQLKNPGPESWEAAGAVLIGPKGELLKPLPLWPSGPLEPGTVLHRLVVEVSATQTEARGTYTLKLWDAGGTRTVTLGNITFPE